MSLKKKILFILIAIIIAVGIYGAYKPLPEGLNIEGQIHSVPSDDIYFYSDKTYVDSSGNRHSDQTIIDEVLNMIDSANQYILIDMFLFNSFLGSGVIPHRELADEITNALIKKKKQNPDIIIQIISDPINNIYGGFVSPHFETLRENGIPVIITNLSILRDSNIIYSSLWRSFLKLIPNLVSLPNVFDSMEHNIGLKSYLKLFNFKANHRKVIVTDFVRSNGNIDFATLITSENFQDASSAHTNTAIKVNGYIWKDVIASESTVAKLSNKHLINPNLTLINKYKINNDGVRVQILTEKAIKNKVLELINSAEKDNIIDLVMFYISDRDIVRALKKADKRGVMLRILLDPNKDAFGREKNGIPNRQVSYELVKNSSGNTVIRWCHTHGEQCHSKLIILTSDMQYSIIQGSGNFTRRNLENLNLELNLYISTPTQIPVITDAKKFFDVSWNNKEDEIYSVEYNFYSDSSIYRTLLYRFTEFTGISSY